MKFILYRIVFVCSFVQIDRRDGFDQHLNDCLFVLIRFRHHVCLFLIGSRCQFFGSFASVARVLCAFHIKKRSRHDQKIIGTHLFQFFVIMFLTFGAIGVDVGLRFVLSLLQNLLSLCCVENETSASLKQTKIRIALTKRK